MLGVTPSKWIGVWKERMPRQPIEARPLDQAVALTSLRAGECDVVLGRLPFENEGLSVIPLYWEKPVVVAEKDHPIAEFESLMLADLSGEVMLAGPSAEAVELAATGAGVAIMPQSVARSLSRRDVVARFVEDAPETRVALVWLEGNDDSRIQEFIGIVRGRTANSSRGG